MNDQPLMKLIRLCECAPEPFFTRAVSPEIITDLMAQISTWETVKAHFKPRLLVRFGALLVFLRRSPVIHQMTASPKYKNAATVAVVGTRAVPTYLRLYPAAANDLLVLEWSITGSQKPLKKLHSFVASATEVEHQALREYLAKNAKPTPEAQKARPVVFSALWLVNNLRQHCPRFKDDWDELVAAHTTG